MQNALPSKCVSRLFFLVALFSLCASPFHCFSAAQPDVFCGCPPGCTVSSGCTSTGCVSQGNCPGLTNCPGPTNCAIQVFPPGVTGCTAPSANQYILRYAITAEHGAISFIGNTLGLSKAACVNQPGLYDSIGAFTTTDPSQHVGSFPSILAGATGGPAGTTLTWQNNASAAALGIPNGATILYAELCWGGSYGYYNHTPYLGNAVGVDPNCVLNFADGPITFITPDNVTHLITADPATRLQSQNPSVTIQPFMCAGNYTRSADVTLILQLLLGANYAMAPTQWAECLQQYLLMRILQMPPDGPWLSFTDSLLQQLIT